MYQQRIEFTCVFSLPWSFFSSLLSSAFTSCASLPSSCFMISTLVSRMSGTCSTPGLCRGVALGVIRGDDLMFLINLSVGFLTSAALGIEGFFGVLWTFGSGGFESFVNFTSPTRSAVTRTIEIFSVLYARRVFSDIYSIYMCNSSNRDLKWYIHDKWSWE